TDYCAIHCAAPASDAYLSRAIERSRGLRILRQEPWETLCGFILSQRKNLKAIRAGMEALCNAFGAPVAGTSRKAFPTAERMARATEAELRACGLGYRAPYLLDAARNVASGQVDLAALVGLSDEALLSVLTGIHGVGVKVANCVMLFAYHRLSRAPVDVWINRVIGEIYGGRSPFEDYGEFAGVYQQYLFILGRGEGFDPAPQADIDCAVEVKSAVHGSTRQKLIARDGATAVNGPAKKASGKRKQAKSDKA
ncbi:MAG TPA: hypothetical protein PLP25_11415, partial [Candidatus Limiplasma sp.]|nr:hypothetical protein [Candidatus Limiplasma sp.]